MRTRVRCLLGFAVITALAWCSPIYAQVSTSLTDNSANAAEVWTAMSDMERTNFVMGYFDGYAAGCARMSKTEGDREKCLGTIPLGLDMEFVNFIAETVATISSVYKSGNYSDTPACLIATVYLESRNAAKETGKDQAAIFKKALNVFADRYNQTRRY